MRTKKEAEFVAHELRQEPYSKTLYEAIEVISKIDDLDCKDFLERKDVKQFWNDYHGAYWEKE